MVKNSLSALTLILLLLPACTPGIRFHPVTALNDAPLGPRAVPAASTKDPGDVLRAQGYAAIGWIGTTPTVTTCSGPACQTFVCAPTGTAPAKLADEILSEAANQGGDLVDLLLGATAMHAVPQGWTKCKRLGTVFRHRDGKHASGDGGTWGWFPGCVEWVRTSGSECATYSGGTVWRRDPELTPRVAAAERDAIEAEAERVRLMGEAVRVREIYGSLYGSYATTTIRYDDLLPYTSWGRFGFRNRHGVTIIEPKFADALQGFSEGMAAVAEVVKGRKRWGFIDRTGAWVIAPRYDRVSDFSEGVASAEADGRAGFIDRSGLFVVRPVFDRASSFRTGIAEVWIDGKAGFYDRSVNKLFAPP